MVIQVRMAAQLPKLLEPINTDLLFRMERLAHEQELNGERPTIRPRVDSLTKSLDRSIGQQLTNGDRKVDGGGCNAAKNNWRDFRAVKRPNGEVEAKADTEDELSYQEFDILICKNFSKDTSGYQN